MTSKGRPMTLAVVALALVGCRGLAHEGAATSIASGDWNCLQQDMRLEIVYADQVDPEARNYAFIGCGHRGTVSCHDVGGVWTCSHPSDMQPGKSAVTAATPTAAAPSGSGCSKDIDCKGDRVCVQGQCADPAAR
jgi:hypothetical protein